MKKSQSPKSTKSPKHAGIPTKTKSLASLFIKSQILTRPVPPPPTTSFTNQTVLVTGSNGGLGFHAARQLLKYGASHLIMAVRSLDKGLISAENLRIQFPEAQIDVWELDQGKYTSVQSFIKKCQTLERLDVAILNAGCIKPGWTLTSDGHEEMLQVNYLSNSLLGISLLPILRNSAKKYRGGKPGRLSFVSSLSALNAEFEDRDKEELFKALDTEPKRLHPQFGAMRYKVTKLLLIMLVKKLGELVNPDEVIVNCVDPGLVVTTGLNVSMPLFVRAFIRIMGLVFPARKPEVGSWTYLDAVSGKGKESHGVFLMNWEVSVGHEMMYTESGKKTMERAWRETVEELRFAGVEGVLKEIKGKES
ncbi:hypothetical protein QBC38DRAFT_378731 [Podospora fimiseda]|uniref:NAD(P)-binding protein n=1 Tax=Podospora fimiseda TaxID=252190 RepID=A0AAN6YJQ9_9PEZI|nr:hypothetical protein QBC38DRAFT_378731 [Podospora fimiseda]